MNDKPIHHAPPDDNNTLPGFVNVPSHQPTCGADPAGTTRTTNWGQVDCKKCLATRIPTVHHGQVRDDLGLTTPFACGEIEGAWDDDWDNVTCEACLPQRPLADGLHDPDLDALRAVDYTDLKITGGAITTDDGLRLDERGFTWGQGPVTYRPTEVIVTVDNETLAIRPDADPEIFGTMPPVRRALIAALLHATANLLEKP